MYIDCNQEYSWSWNNSGLNCAGSIIHGFFFSVVNITEGFPGGSVVKNPPANARDLSSIPGSGRFPGEGNGYLLQYAYLKNSMDRGAWWATVHQVSKESDTTEQQSITEPQDLQVGWVSRCGTCRHGQSTLSYMRVSTVGRMSDPNLCAIRGCSLQ